MTAMRDSPGDESSMIGKTISHYGIIEKLGQGGMGEVYRAEDTNLGRQVAVKVLPESLGGDAERMARFEREARVLASLNHPNIATIYGLEQAEGKRFLAMELVEGVTLAQRIAIGPLPADEAFELCRQIAEGLAAAHEKGIVHRDLKPSNIKVTPEGKVKILDFGLAKAFQAESPSADGSKSPTLTDEMTRPGMILGTAAYMSPEQARGRAVDKRADIWAFGCILYECLTGTRAFAGETVTEALASILKGEPDWALLPPATPAGVRTIMGHCLKKDPRLRFHDIADVQLEIAEAMAQPLPAPRAQAVAARQVSLRMAALLTLAAVGITTVLCIMMLRKSDNAGPPRPLVQLPLFLPSGQRLTNTGRHVVAVSPDGTQIAYCANSQIHTKRLDEPGGGVPIRDTDGMPFLQSYNPFFSPDGQWVGFFARMKLWKASVHGGPPRILCDCPAMPFGVSWDSSGVIVFSQGSGGIWRVPADGGKAEVLVRLDRGKGEVAQSPQLLNRGKAILFTLGISGAPWNDARVIVQDLRSGERKVLVEGGTDARCVPTGHLVYLRNKTLYARAFDPDRQELRGQPVSLMEGVAEAEGITGAAQFDFSTNGVLAYVNPGALIYKRNLVWVNHTGDTTQAVKEVQPFWLLSLSPDGTRAAVAYRMQEQRTELWVYDLTNTRPAWPLKRDIQAWNPLFTPDGSQVVFSWNDGIYLMPADGSTRDAKCLVTRKGTQGPYSFSSGGDELFFQDEATGDIAVISMKGAHEVKTILDTGYVEAMPAISPDDRWIAYTSDRTGTREIWAASYPDFKNIQRVSFSGGFEPRWSRDAKELYFWQGNSMMASSLDAGNKFSVPRELFRGDDFVGAGTNWPIYGVARDGRYLMIRDLRSTSEQPDQKINVVVNWFDELERLVPAGKR